MIIKLKIYYNVNTVYCTLNHRNDIPADTYSMKQTELRQIYVSAVAKAFAPNFSL